MSYEPCSRMGSSNHSRCGNARSLSRAGRARSVASEFPAHTKRTRATRPLCSARTTGPRPGGLVAGHGRRTGRVARRHDVQGGTSPPPIAPRHHPERRQPVGSAECAVAAHGVDQPWAITAHSLRSRARLPQLKLPRLHAPQARGAYAYPRPVCDELSRDQLPNQRCRRVAANSSFSAARSAEGPRNGAVGAAPDMKSASTLPTKPPPNSM